LRPPALGSDIGQIPPGPNHLTNEWLTAALCRGTPSARVVDFEMREASEGASSRRAVRVAYNEVGTSAGLPTALFSKSLPRLLSRVLVGISGIGGGEPMFYESIRRELDIGAPEGYFGGWDNRAWRYLVLIEDVAVTRAATFPDEGIQVDRGGAEGMVCEMAAYHGRLWEDPRLDSLWGLSDTYSWQHKFNRHAGCDLGAVAAFRWEPDAIPRELHVRRREIRPALMRSLEHNVRAPATLLHQDTHPRNWFRLPDGSVHLYDWQTVAKGNWALDVSYALSSVLPVEDRRKWERELLELYLDRLGSAGGTPPSFEVAWVAYRQQLIHAFIFWAFTVAVNKLSDVHPRDVTRVIVERTAQAMVDHDTLDAIGT